MRDQVRSSLRGHAFPVLAAFASLFALSLLVGGVRFQLAPSPQSSAAVTVIYVPAGAHASGANGASWRTDVEVHNPGTTTASFAVQLLKRDTSNISPTSKSYTLGAGQSRRFTDALMSEFAFDGAAALRFNVSAGLLVVASRTYNLVGSNPWSLPEGSSFGQFEPGVAETDAIGYGQEGRIIQLTQQPSSSLDGFRTNIGLVNTTAITIATRVDCYKSDGTFLGTATTNLPPYGFSQMNEVFGQWGTIADGYAIVKTPTSGGALFAFATVIDNHNSGDPIFVPAVRMSSSAGTPTPTATPTTPAGSKPNLYIYKPSAWPACLVANYQPGCCNTTSCCSPFLSTYYTTNFHVFVANSGAATATGPIRFAVAIDGTVKQYANYDNPGGIQPGYGVVLSWAYSDPVAAGTHALTITVDPDNTISESNESDNSCATSANWTSIVLGHGGPAALAPHEGRASAGAPFRIADGPPAALAAPAPLAPAPLASAPGTIYIPAAAHAAGMNGANWRTDVEVHNPGATAVSFQFALLPQATDNSGSSPTRSFSIGPQQSVRYVDILSSVFSTSGAAAFRILPTGGATILVNSRTYNLIGTNSVGLPVGASFGQYVPGIPETDAIGYGEEGRIVMLTHRDSSSYTDFRTNIGFVNTTSTPIDLRIDLYRANGTPLGSIQDASTHLRGYEFQQTASIFGAYSAWVDDGFAVIKTVTPGGRFFAFATVIDNHLTGDPIFIPATKLTGSSSPTPTPTNTVPGPTSTPTLTPTPTATVGPSPTPATNTISVVDILDGAMIGLGHSGSGTINIADIANTAKSNGLDAALTQIANASPSIISKSGTSLVVNYGSSHTAKDGTVYTGSATIATSSFTVNGTHVVWQGAVTSNNIKRDGKPLGTGTGNVKADYTASGSTVIGDVSGTATSTSNPGSSATGSVHVDTSVCPKYPISGTLTANQGGKTYSATFTQSCDGSYTLTGTGVATAGYEVSLKKCDGTYRTDYPYFKIGVVEAGGSLTLDPACGNKTVGGFYNIRVRGTTTATSVTLAWAFDLGGGSTGLNLHHYAGVFTGTRSGPGVPVNGTTTYTVAVSNGCSNNLSESSNSHMTPKAAGCTF